ncbi:MAG TPA: MFS transporter, partial [Actinomycetota bacterium]|nr:MFS transporter [Actinomycetota bacterium]
MRAPDRDRLVRRSTLILSATQALAWAGAGVFATFGALSVEHLFGGEASVGFFIATFWVSAAVGAPVAGRLMDRFGRRPGLAAGHGLITVSGLAAAASVASGSGAALVASAVPMGLGASAALLARVAVADMHPPESRARAVGLMVAAGTIGAVGGPVLGGFVHGLAEGRGVAEPLGVPWLLLPVFGLACLLLLAMLRPDPRDLAVARPTVVARPSAGRIFRLRPGIVAVATIGATQPVMTTFMGLSAVVLSDHGVGEGAISAVVSGHLAGMLAFSPVIGVALDRWGRRTGLIVGLAITAIGVPVTAIPTDPAAVGVGLFLVGVGWSVAYLGSTTVVSDLTEPAERAGALGLTDLVAAVASALGVLGGAALLQATSFPTLGVVALVLLMIP